MDGSKWSYCWHNQHAAVIDNSPNAAADELASLRAEVARLQRALDQRLPNPPQPRPRRTMEPDPELPGLSGLWRGERGLGWRLFVQGAVTIMAALAVVTIIAIAAS